MLNWSSLVCVCFSQRLHGRVCHDLEHEASDEGLQVCGTQGRGDVCPVLTLWSSGGLRIQRQDSPALGAQCVSHYEPGHML